MSGGGGSTTSTTQNYSPEEAARRTQVMDEAARIYGSTKDSLINSPYPGAAPVPYSPETLWAQQYAMNYAMGPAIQQAANVNNAVQFGLKDVLYPESNPALQQTIEASIRPIREEYMDPGGIMSTIRTNAGQAEQFGSSRQGIAEGIAAGRYADAVGDTAARVATEGYNKGLDTFGKTLAFAPQALEMGLMPMNLAGSVGYQNEQLAREMEQYLSDSTMWQYNAPWAPLQNYASIVFGGANPSTTSQTNASQSALGTVGQIGTTAMAMYALYAM